MSSAGYQYFGYLKQALEPNFVSFQVLRLLEKRTEQRTLENTKELKNAQGGWMMQVAPPHLSICG